MFPMKFFEYLAAGKPVVSTDLPALKDYRTLVHIGVSPSDFIEKIEIALTEDGRQRLSRLEAARKHTYAKRLEEMMDIVGGL